MGWLIGHTHPGGKCCKTLLYAPGVEPAPGWTLFIRCLLIAVQIKKRATSYRGSGHALGLGGNLHTFVTVVAVSKTEAKVATVGNISAQASTNVNPPPPPPLYDARTAQASTAVLKPFAGHLRRGRPPHKTTRRKNEQTMDAKYAYRAPQNE